MPHLLAKSLTDVAYQLLPHLHLKLGIEVDGDGLEGGRTAGSESGTVADAEVLQAIEAILGVYVQHRTEGEPFIEALRRIGHEPFRAAAHQVRHLTARQPVTA